MNLASNNTIRRNIMISMKQTNQNNKNKEKLYYYDSSLIFDIAEFRRK